MSILVSGQSLSCGPVDFVAIFLETSPGLVLASGLVDFLATSLDVADWTLVPCLLLSIC